MTTPAPLTSRFTSGAALVLTLAIGNNARAAEADTSVVVSAPSDTSDRTASALLAGVTVIALGLGTGGTIAAASRDTSDTFTGMMGVSAALVAAPVVAHGIHGSWWGALFGLGPLAGAAVLAGSYQAHDDAFTAGRSAIRTTTTLAVSAAVVTSILGVVTVLWFPGANDKPARGADARLAGMPWGFRW